MNKHKGMMTRQGVIAGLQCLEFHFRSVAAETTDAVTRSAIDEIVETLDTAIDMLRAAPELLVTQRLIDPGVTPDAAADASAVKGDRGARMLDGDVIKGNTVSICLTNADTRNLKPGTAYAWDVRVVTDPEYDDEGNAYCGDDTDCVISVFSGSTSLPSFNLIGVSSNV